jgi:regulator of sigma E protease
VYKIGILPLGGYVALPQLDPTAGNPHKGEKKVDTDERVLPRVGPVKKILVSLAGVTCNMILAILLAHVVFWGGKSFAPDKTNIVG